MRSLLFATSFLIPRSALAEVCDKERPFWSPADGPVGQLGELMWTLAHPLGLVLVVAAAFALTLRRRWLYAIAGSVFALMALLVGSIWFESDHVFMAAIREGCRATPVLTVIFLSAVALWFVWRAATAQRRAKNAH